MGSDDDADDVFLGGVNETVVVSTSCYGFWTRVDDLCFTG
jgi:hypothetical protein